MIERNRDLRFPVLRPSRAECQEHRLEQCTALCSALEFLWSYVEPPDLLAKPVDHFLRSTSISKRRNILIQNRFARSSRIMPLCIGYKYPIVQARRLIRR